MSPYPRALACSLNMNWLPMFALILYIPVNNFHCFDPLHPSQQFSVISGRVYLPGWVYLETSTKQKIKCFAQGHIAVPPVRFQPPTPLSRVQPSTTEPLPSSLVDYAISTIILCAGSYIHQTLLL